MWHNRVREHPAEPAKPMSNAEIRAGQPPVNAARPGTGTPGRAYQAMERTDSMPPHLSDSSVLLSKNVPRVELQIAAVRNPATLDIGSRPRAAAPAVVVQFCQMPDRLWTYEVKVGPPDARCV